MLAHRSSLGARPLAANRALVRAAPRRALVVENAHKKGAGSTKNGRDSNSKSRGVKAYGGQPIKAGGIIVRQLGSTVRGAAGPVGQCGRGGAATRRRLGAVCCRRLHRRARRVHRGQRTGRPM